METYKVAKVVLPIADKEFDYSLPPRLSVKEGDRVVVDFQNRRRLGIVVGLGKKSQIKCLKPVISVLDAGLSLTPPAITFAKQLSKTYPYALGEFLFMMLPPYLRRAHKPPAGAGQRAVAEEIPPASVTPAANVFIKGPTFLKRYRRWKEIVRAKLSEGSVVVCFPQVSYLKEAQAVLEKDFSRPVHIIHSQQPEKELFLTWQNSRSRALILGTRVAAFYYPPDLSLVVMEEENSRYYFQEEKPFYHLRDVVLILAGIKKISVVLSGDYPTLSAYNLIKENTFVLEEITPEPAMPGPAKITVVDMGGYQRKKVVNPVLEELLRKNMEEKETSVVLWNRRGFASSLSCSGCGHIFKCDRCSSFLQLPLQQEQGVCPYCGRKAALPKICPHCNSGYIKVAGLGIERIGVILARTFPSAKIARWESAGPDTQIILATSKILSALYTGRTFAKGFLLDVDSFLSHRDYEATMEAFFYVRKLSLLFTENFYVFTRNRKHCLFENLGADWRAFYEQELMQRKELGLPPFGVITKIVLRGEEENKILKKTESLYNRLKDKKEEVYGPFKESPFKLRGNFRYALIVKSAPARRLRQMIKEEVKLLRKSHIKLAVIIR